MYVTLVASISSPIVRVGSPNEIVDFFAVPLIALIEVGVMQMFLLIMVQLLEFSANSIAKHLPNTSEGGSTMATERHFRFIRLDKC